LQDSTKVAVSLGKSGIKFNRSAETRDRVIESSDFAQGTPEIAVRGRKIRVDGQRPTIVQRGSVRLAAIQKGTTKIALRCCITRQQFSGGLQYAQRVLVLHLQGSP